MLHLVMGESVGNSLRRALNGEELLVLPDDLSCGPAIAASVGHASTFLQARRHFWADVVQSETSLNAVNLEPALKGVCEAPAVALWIASSAQEQLFAAFVCALLESARSNAQVHIVRVNSVPNRAGNPVQVRSLAVLNEHEFALAPAARELSLAETQSLSRTWGAWVSQEPLAFFGSTRPHGDTSRLGMTGLRALVGRYPDRECGLSAWDLALLENVRACGPRLVRVIGQTLGDAETDDLVGDAWLFWRARRMAAPPFPLIRFDTSSSDMRACTVSPTEDGVAVLDGKTNAITLNGIDDWVGGVHLDSAAGRVWVRSGAELVAWKAGG